MNTVLHDHENTQNPLIIFMLLIVKRLHIGYIKGKKDSDTIRRCKHEGSHFFFVHFVC